MPRYEYRCLTCDERFEVWRSMSAAGEPAACPDGHAETVRLLSMFATTGVATGGPRWAVAAAAAAAPAAAPTDTSHHAASGDRADAPGSVWFRSIR